MCDSKLGPNSTTALEYVDDLAIFFANGGDSAEAERYFKRAHQTRCMLHGASHEETLRSEDNLAMFYDSEGLLEAAERSYRSVHKGRSETLGHSDPKTVASAYNLAVVLSASLRNADEKESQGMDEAVSLFASSLASMETEFGWTDDRTTHCAEKLAELYQTKGQYDMAENFFGKSLMYRVQTPPASLRRKWRALHTTWRIA
jgi:tetratricopeptide (TPR) repeat protein